MSDMQLINVNKYPFEWHIKKQIRIENEFSGVS